MGTHLTGWNRRVLLQCLSNGFAPYVHEKYAQLRRSVQVTPKKKEG